MEDVHSVVVDDDFLQPILDSLPSQLSREERKEAEEFVREYRACSRKMNMTWDAHH